VAAYGVLRVKSGVRFDRIAPAGFRILAALDNAARVMGVDLTITCGTEGHPSDDPHSTGEAVDVSVSGLSILLVLKFHLLFKQLLGDLFTVLYEVPKVPDDPDLAKIAYVNAAASGPHFHIQRRKHTTFPPLRQTDTATV
jgi:hypothetical protein